MGGTRAGGLKAAKTNIEKHGKGFYREIGRRGAQRTLRRIRKRSHWQRWTYWLGTVESRWQKRRNY